MATVTEDLTRVAEALRKPWPGLGAAEQAAHEELAKLFELAVTHLRRAGNTCPSHEQLLTQVVATGRRFAAVVPEASGG